MTSTMAVGANRREPREVSDPTPGSMDVAGLRELGRIAETAMKAIVGTPMTATLLFETKMEVSYEMIAISPAVKCAVIR